MEVYGALRPYDVPLPIFMLLFCTINTKIWTSDTVKCDTKNSRPVAVFEQRKKSVFGHFLSIFRLFVIYSVPLYYICYPYSILGQILFHFWYIRGRNLWFWFNFWYVLLWSIFALSFYIFICIHFITFYVVLKQSRDPFLRFLMMVHLFTNPQKSWEFIQQET